MDRKKYSADIRRLYFWKAIFALLILLICYETVVSLLFILINNRLMCNEDLKCAPDYVATYFDLQGKKIWVEQNFGFYARMSFFGRVLTLMLTIFSSIKSWEIHEIIEKRVKRARKVKTLNLRKG